MRSCVEAPTLEAGAYILRPLWRRDAAALLPTFSDEAHCRFMSRAAFANEQELADWLTDPSWNGRSWVAVSKADAQVAGRFVVIPGRDAGVVEVGYVTALHRQRRGVALAAMRALIDHLFAHEGVRRIFAEIDADNAPSIALAERLGFVREGVLRRHEITHKGLCDMAIYGLLRSDWHQGDCLRDGQDGRSMPQSVDPSTP